MHFHQAPAISTTRPRLLHPLGLLLCGIAALTLAACGGGGGDGATGGSGGQPDLGALAGTYALKSGSTVVGALMLDRSASATICTLGTRGCTARITAPATSGASTQFTLTSSEDGSSASGSIALDGAVSGQLTKASGTTEALSGSKVSSNYAGCESPFTRVDGQCTPPASGVVIAPTIVWLQEVSSSGQTFTMQLCYSPLGRDCTAISDPIFVSNADLADEETPEIIAYARTVAQEFQAMIGRLWAAKTFPTHDQLVQIFRNAVDTAINTGTPNAVQTAGSAFTSAGFAAATGGTASGPAGTSPSAESVCSTQSYPGDTSEPQVYLFDKLAQFDACMYKATNNADYLKDGNTQCRVLDGLLKATIGNFTPLYCTGAQLKS